MKFPITYNHKVNAHYDQIYRNGSGVYHWSNRWYIVNNIDKVYGHERYCKDAWDFGRIKDSPEKHEPTQ